eukprot:IDg525t1
MCLSSSLQINHVRRMSNHLPAVLAYATRVSPRSASMPQSISRG